jgi:hypothetical protein
MTRIGRCRVRPDNLASNASYGETISPRSKFPDQPPSINQLCQRSLGCLIGVHTRMGSHPQGLFLKSPLRLTKFKDTDAIANAICCAPLPEILIQNF